MVIGSPSKLKGDMGGPHMYYSHPSFGIHSNRSEVLSWTIYHQILTFTTSVLLTPICAIWLTHTNYRHSTLLKFFIVTNIAINLFFMLLWLLYIWVNEVKIFVMWFWLKAICMVVESTYLWGEHDCTYLWRARVLDLNLKVLLSTHEVINIMMARIFSFHVFMLSFENRVKHKTGICHRMYIIAWLYFSVLGPINRIMSRNEHLVTGPIEGYIHGRNTKQLYIIWITSQILEVSYPLFPCNTFM